MVQGDSLLIVSNYILTELENIITGSRHPPKSTVMQSVRLLSSALVLVIFVDLALQLLMDKEPQATATVQNFSLMC